MRAGSHARQRPMLKRTQVSEVTGVERVGEHSHIRGLGLGPGLEAEDGGDGEGLVGQLAARRAAGVVVRMVRAGRISGRAILLSGQPGSGKTALAMGIAKSLGEDTPFTHISGSELFSLEFSKTEALTQAFRKSIGVRFRETVDVIEGEVLEIEVDRTNLDGKEPRKVGRITMATTEMEALYDLGDNMIAQLQKQGVTAGDVIQIDRSAGSVKRLGRSFARNRDFDANGPDTTFIAVPDGELQRKKEVVHVVTLHELDVINSRPQGFLALFAGDTGEVRPEIRAQIEQKVSEWRDESQAEVISGVLFIDEVHMLDVECYSFLNRALEAPMAPLLVMATNRGVTEIRGTEYRSPHGMPLDLLDRTLIIPTQPYTKEEIKRIIEQRAREEGSTLSADAWELLASLALQASLRYALHVLTLSYVLARKQQSETVEMKHVERIAFLFADVKRSVKFLLECKDDFLYSADLAAAAGDNAAATAAEAVGDVSGGDRSASKDAPAAPMVLT